MSEKLQILVNKRIERIEIIHDYVQVHFFEGEILNIFNTYSIIGALNPKLEGYKIAAVNQGKENIDLLLLPEGIIQIGLQDADYRGPEAMEYTGEHGPCVVWP